MATTGKQNGSKRVGKRKDRALLKQQDWSLGLSVVHPKAAGIDVGNEEHYVAIPPSFDSEPVRKFGCFTRDLKALANWLHERGIETVALQSTGVYWIGLYDMLSERGIKVFVVNARDTKNMPGRKSDVQECQWLLKLHVYGLLKNSFRPKEEICVLRTLWRQRQQHVADGARCIQHMQKGLSQMNLQLANVISDLSGWTGQAIIQAILDGERNPHKLAELRDPRVKASAEVIAKSLEGNWREELLFVLRQEFESYKSLQEKIGECDRELEQRMSKMEQKADPELLEPCPRNKRAHGNIPENFDLRKEQYRITGVDLAKVDGINVLTAQNHPGGGRSRYDALGDRVPFCILAESSSQEPGQRRQSYWAGQTQSCESRGTGPAPGRQHITTQSNLFGISISPLAHQTRRNQSDQGHG
jgi:transposase